MQTTNLVSKYIIRDYTPADKDEALKLKEIFTSSKEDLGRLWDWQYHYNPANPSQDPLGWVIEAPTEEIVGCLLCMFINLRLGNSVTKALWGTNFFVKEGFGNRAPYLLKRMMNAPYLTLGFPNEKAYHFEKAVGVFDIYPVPITYIKLVSAKRILERRIKNSLLTILGGILWDIISESLFDNGLTITKTLQLKRIESFDERIDVLWQDCSSDHDVIAVRDKRYLNWRFVEYPNTKYDIYIAEDKEGKIQGYCVSCIRKKDGILEGLIVDILARNADLKTLKFLIFNACLRLKRRGVHIVSCLMMPQQRRYIKALRTCGFLFKRHRHNFFIGYYTSKEKTKIFFDEYVRKSKRWFITYCDGELSIST